MYVIKNNLDRYFTDGSCDKLWVEDVGSAHLFLLTSLPESIEGLTGQTYYRRGLTYEEQGGRAPFAVVVDVHRQPEPKYTEEDLFLIRTPSGLYFQGRDATPLWSSDYEQASVFNLVELPKLIQGGSLFSDMHRLGDSYQYFVGSACVARAYSTFRDGKPKPAEPDPLDEDCHIIKNLEHQYYTDDVLNRWSPDYDKAQVFKAEDLPQFLATGAGSPDLRRNICGDYRNDSPLGARVHRVQSHPEREELRSKILEQIDGRAARTGSEFYLTGHMPNRPRKDNYRAGYRKALEELKAEIQSDDRTTAGKTTR